MQPQSKKLGEVEAQRKSRIETLARATAGELQEFVTSIGDLPKTQVVRGPETGLVMIRGRMGGTGSVFNLGEATITRATVQLASGEVGHGQRLGTDREAAQLSAVVDALASVESYEFQVSQFVARIEARLQSEDQKQEEETAATRVNFFTMVRGDD